MDAQQRVPQTPHPTRAVKILETVKTVFTVAIMVLAVVMMIFTVVSVTCFDKNDRDLFGYKLFIIRSDSMSKTDFSAGDLILLKEVDPATLEVGDIVSFRSIDPATFGETFTHKIREVTEYDGQPAFVTYGTTTEVDDAYPAPFGNVIGKYVDTVPGVGTFFTFLKTVPGYICCILLPFLVLIVIQGVNSVHLFRQYRAEQMAELNATRDRQMAEMEEERKRLEAEREASRKMFEELQQLKAEMNAKQNENDCS